MKIANKLKVILFLTIFGILTSCSSDNEGEDVPSTGSYVTAKIDSESYTTVNNGIVTATRFGSGSETNILILGTTSEGNTMSISLLGVTAPDTYTINPSSDSTIQFFDNSSETFFGTDSCETSSGTITVSFLSESKIEGTFSFSGKDDNNCSATGRNVTNGSFRGVFLSM